MSININSTPVSPLSFGPIDDPLLLTIDSSRDIIIVASGETVTVDLAYNNEGNPSSVGYLDYISVQAVQGI